MMDWQRSEQASLFYEFRLDDRIPKDHLLRRIDAVTPIRGEVREQLKSARLAGRRSILSCRVLLRLALGAQAGPGSRVASGVWLVLPA